MPSTFFLKNLGTNFAVCCASGVFLPTIGEITAVMAVSAHLICLHFVSISFFNVVKQLIYTFYENYFSFSIMHHCSKIFLS